MGDPDVIRTYSEFERRYLPRTVVKRERDNETAEDAGRRIARDALDGSVVNEEPGNDVQS